MNREPVPLEDTWTDVLRKALTGAALPAGELERRSGLSASRIAELMAGALEPRGLADLCGALGLDARCLLAMARGEYHPGRVRLPQGVAMFSSPWHDFEVHSYLVWDPSSAAPRAAAAFDSGSDASEMLEFAGQNRLAVKQVFLTHSHGDHLFDLERLTEKTGARGWIGEGENVEGPERFRAGRTFRIGSLAVETRSTRGHTAGGITYVIRGLEQPVAVVGDALFAGSMGGPLVSYAACLETNRRELFSLPPETVLCPGHGPLTTVAKERANNPFFASNAHPTEA
jgi:hydroxyacylglutathione hydrolase